MSKTHFRHDRAGTAAATWTTAIAARELADLALPAGCDRLLVVGAHPDDETLGASGLMRLADRAGWSIEVVCATSGEGSHPQSPTVSRDRLAMLRRDELRAAVAVVAATAEVTCLDLPDGAVADHAEALVARLVETIGTSGDRVLLCAPWRSDGHPDHEAVGRAAAVAAVRTDATLLEYPVWLWHWGDADDLPWKHVRRLPLDEDTRRAKRRAVATHTTQVQPLSPSPGDEALLGPDLLAHFDRDLEVFIGDPAPTPDDVLERVHRDEADPWQVDSFYERRKRAVTLAALPDEHYGRILEVGCSVGALALDLAQRGDELLAIDASDTAVAAARARTSGLAHVAVRRLDVPSQWPLEAFDLISISEVGYFLSPHGLDEVVALALGSLTPDGHLLLCHWRHQPVGWTLAGPAVHDAFLATGAPVLVEHHESDFLLHVLGRPR